MANRLDSGRRKFLIQAYKWILTVAIAACLTAAYPLGAAHAQTTAPFTLEIAGVTGVVGICEDSPYGNSCGVRLTLVYNVAISISGNIGPDFSINGILAPDGSIVSVPPTRPNQLTFKVGVCPTTPGGPCTLTPGQQLTLTYTATPTQHVTYVGSGKIPALSPPARHLHDEIEADLATAIADQIHRGSIDANDLHSIRPHSVTWDA